MKYPIISLNSKLLFILGCGLAGGCASVVTDTIYFPLDSIKTRLQVNIISLSQSLSALFLM